MLWKKKNSHDQKIFKISQLKPRLLIEDECSLLNIAVELGSTQRVNLKFKVWTSPSWWKKNLDDSVKNSSWITNLADQVWSNKKMTHNSMIFFLSFFIVTGHCFES